ncbi:MAG: ATP-grasp domain-containing protein [Deltaproteobacteria bacterium]|nr:ATP-grasp domain-containing protein [Deltaproteobacteria bacterium]
MIRKLLIANRGEIVSRIIRTCRVMGIATVAVYSEPDRNAPYLKEADEAVLIGPANPLQSYLNMDALLEAARRTGAEAVHPGYGFLSERGLFAEAVVNAGLIWVGPAPQVLRTISSKSYCRQLAHEVEVPVIPGTLELLNEASEIKDYGRRQGYPLFIKLDRGGGGKGIEVVHSEDQAEEVFQRAASIGQMAFGHAGCYIEAVVAQPRHIEIQFLADSFGNCVCLSERECSIQRRHQKIIEESPSVVVGEDERRELFDRTRRLVRRMGYQGAGTIENLRSADGRFYFMEINARLQVEHPVTEFLTGVDIVRCQLEIASGEKLAFGQADVTRQGHAVEARVYAEDPDTFFPSPGTISALELPAESDHLRIDHALADQGVIPPYYDPLLAKVIAWDHTRPQAVERLVQALKDFRIEGVKTTIPANLKILEHPRFLTGDFTTAFIHEMLGEKPTVET